MLSDTDIQALMDAAMRRFQVTLTYMKKTDGTTVTHTVGIVEMTGDTLWGWDTQLNDHIRRFYMENIQGIQVLPFTFNNIAAGNFPLKINGQVIAGV